MPTSIDPNDIRGVQSKYLICFVARHYWAYCFLIEWNVMRCLVVTLYDRKDILLSTLSKASSLCSERSSPSSRFSMEFHEFETWALSYAWNMFCTIEFPHKTTYQMCCHSETILPFSIVSTINLPHNLDLNRVQLKVYSCSWMKKRLQFRWKFTLREWSA